LKKIRFIALFAFVALQQFFAVGRTAGSVK